MNKRQFDKNVIDIVAGIATQTQKDETLSELLKFYNELEIIKDELTLLRQRTINAPGKYEEWE